MNYRTLTGEDIDAVASSENNSAKVTAPHWGNHEDISPLQVFMTKKPQIAANILTKLEPMVAKMIEKGN